MVVLAVAFITRLVLIVVFKTYSHPIVWEYEEIANNLLGGRGYSFKHLNTTYWSSGTPLYAFLCAAIYAVTGHSFFAVLLIQSLFSIALALTVFFIAKIIFSDTVGVLAAAAVAFHPGFIYYDVFNLIPLSIDSFFIALIALVLVRISLGRASARSSLLLGGLIGLGTLSRGVIGVLLVLVVGYLIFVASHLKPIQRLKVTACVIAVAVLTLAPWLIRNYVVQRQLVFISTSSGELFWRGNNQHATGTLHDRNKTNIFKLWPQEFRDRVHSMTELEQKTFFENEARRFIRDNPSQAARLYARKVYYFWWFSPQSGINYPSTYLNLYKVLYAGLLSLAVVGLIFALRSSRKEIRNASLIVIAMVITICLAQSLFYVEGRHRWLVEPLVLVFSCYGLVRLWKTLKWKLDRSTNYENHE